MKKDYFHYGMVMGVIWGLFVAYLFILACDAYGEDLLSGNEHWGKVELLGNFTSTDPLFSDTAEIRQTLIKDAYGWLQNLADGYHFLDQLTCSTNTTHEVSYNLEPAGFVNEVLPVRIKAVRRLSTSNPQALTSMSIDDLNKVFELNVSYPEIYAYDRSHIYFNAYPAAICTHYVWAYRTASLDSTTLDVESEQAGARKPILFSTFRPILWLRTTALARGKEGNEIADANITGIALSMMVDLCGKTGIYQMIEAHKDIRILPQVYGE